MAKTASGAKTDPAPPATDLPLGPVLENMTPRQIVAELDK